MSDIKKSKCDAEVNLHALLRLPFAGENSGIDQLEKYR